MNIFDFFLSLVRHYPPDAARQEFRILFLEYRANAMNAEAFADLRQLVTARDQQGFLNMLKRCCYILVNNWETERESACVVALVQEFTEFDGKKRSLDKERARVQSWLQLFIDSQDYQDLRLFAARHDPNSSLGDRDRWSQRYTSYLLVPQYADSSNSPEQRQAARQLSQELKTKFKFDLAMYTARSQLGARSPSSQPASPSQPENPTGLGENVLKLIKKLVVRHGQFSYDNLAHIFIKQTRDIPYVQFKDALYNYLVFAIKSSDPSEAGFHQQLYRRLSALYPKYDDQRVTEGDSLVLRTCNRLFNYLTTEDGEQPAELFVLLLTQGNPLMLAMMLLKVVLICPSSRTHLESRIAVLIRYYMDVPESECQWVVNFFEIFRIAFAIYADRDVKYDLIRVDAADADAGTTGSSAEGDAPLETYRIFSQQASSLEGWSLERDIGPLESHLSY